MSVAISDSRLDRRHPAGPTNVEIIDDARRFTLLRPEWNSLLTGSRADCPFLTWEWLHAWWTHLGGGTRRLQLLTVRAGNELIGVAPLALACARLPWLSTLEFLGTGHAGSDYLDLIVRRNREEEGVRAMADSLIAQKRTLRLDHLPPSSLSAQLADELAAHGWTSLAASSGVCPVVTLAGHSWDSYLAMLGAAHRANVRRRMRAIERRFDVCFSRVLSEPERREGLSTLVALHNRRWNRRGGSTAFPTRALCAFHDEVTRLALEAGWLRLYVLRLDAAPVAALYGFVRTGRFYFYQSAFDERYGQYGIGMVMMGLAIRAAIEEGLLEFDLLYGTESYKQLWARDQRLLERRDLFPANVGGRIHRRTVQAKRTARRLAHRILPRGNPCETSLAPAGACF